MGYGGGGGDGGAAQQEAQREAKINTGETDINNAFAGFDSDFYNQRKQDYEDFAMPTVQDQYHTTSNNLAYSLARNGILNSSTAIQRGQSLNRELATQTRGVADAGQEQANELQTNVQNQKSNLVSQLIASGDPSTVSANIGSITAGLQAPSAFTPIANVFNSWSNQYLNNQASQATATATSPQPMFQFGTSGNNNSSFIVQ